MYLEEWNGGYWISEFHIEPIDDTEPSIHKKTYEDIQYEIYPTGEQKNEVWVKIENEYYDLEPSSNIPIGVLGLPQKDIKQLSVRNTPRRFPILIVKPWFHDYLTWDKIST